MFRLWSDFFPVLNWGEIVYIRFDATTFTCLVILISYVVSNVAQDNKSKINTIDKNDNISFCYLQKVSYLYDRLDRW